METLIALIKTLPSWLGAVAEVLLVAITFMAAVTFLAGIWVGLLVIKRRARSIEKFTLIPFSIEFKVDVNPKEKDDAS